MLYQGQLARMGVSVMLAGNMGDEAVNVLASNGIKTIRGCAGDVHEVVQAWLARKLDDSGAVCQSHDSGGCPGHS
jgi:predicted Fe-Mo cluster-binding NifX family protein